MNYENMATTKNKKELTDEELEKKRKKEGTAPKDKDTAARDIWKPKRDKMDLTESEAPTVQRVMDIAERVSKGESRMGLQRWMQENWQIGDRQARAYYMAAVRYLIPDDEDEYKKGLIQANLNRLEEIVENTMTGRNYKDAISAIKELNRMLGIGEKNTVEVATDSAIFKVSFGE
jgi:hypothetical protein